MTATAPARPMDPESQRATITRLLEAGVHFGHQKKRWNPKMRPYIFSERNGIHIIDLEKTAQLLEEASERVAEATRRGGRILFVGTKKQAQDVVKKEAERSGQFYVNQRWLGGTLTNFVTIRKSIQRLKEIEAMLADGSDAILTKKERIRLERERQKLSKNLIGIKEMEELPDILFVIDPKKEAIAVQEAQKLGVPVVAIVDTNCDPDSISFVIPGNDDAIRAIKLFTSKISDAVLEGLHAQEERFVGKLGKDEVPDEPMPENFVVATPAVEPVVPVVAGEAAAAQA